MDTDTGTEQLSSEWNNGLHLFLQFKHSLRVSAETLPAVFRSNMEHVKWYARDGGRIHGLTGTLGSQAEFELLSDIYDSVAFVKVPTFKESRLTIDPALLVPTSTTDWQQLVYLEAREAVAKGRSVLVVAQDVRMAEALHGSLAGAFAANDALQAALKTRAALGETGRQQCADEDIAADIHYKN